MTCKGLYFFYGVQRKGRFEGFANHTIGTITIPVNSPAGEFPAFPVEEVDPTEAGDIFASSFLIKYKQTEDITQAAAFAHAAASFIVEDYGITIPDLKDIEERYESYLAKFIV